MKRSILLGALALTVTATAMPEAAFADSRSEIRREIRRDIKREHRKKERRNTLIGAGVGMLGGAILSGGDPWATVAGAAAGGVVGNVTTEKRRYRLRDRDWRQRDGDWRD